MKTKKFERTGQLYQLRRLDPAAHKSALAALGNGFVALANEIVRKAMLAALERLSPKSQPAQPTSFDLVVASKKYGVGSTTQLDAPVLWWKRHGEEMEKPAGRITLLDPRIQAMLAGYDLADTEIQPSQIIRRYRRIPTGFAVCDAHHINPDPAGPHTIRCRRRARYQLIIRAGEIQTLCRCRACRDELREQVSKGATFEILDETLLAVRNVN